MANEKTKKVTKKENFNRLLKIEAVKNNSALVEFIEHELDLLNRKNASDRKLTGNAAENVELKKEVLEILSAEPNRLFTATEVWKKMKDWEKFSNQRVSSLLRQLIDEGKAVKTKDKKKSLFQLAD